MLDYPKNENPPSVLTVGGQDSAIISHYIYGSGFLFYVLLPLDGQQYSRVLDVTAHPFQIRNFHILHEM